MSQRETRESRLPTRIGRIGAGIAVALFVLSAHAADHAVPERFRSEPAVVLEDTRVWTVDVEGSATFSIKKRILLQDRRGFDLADQGFGYSKPGGEVVGFAARTVLPNGEVVDVPEDLRRDSLLYKEGEDEYRYVQFTFPAVEEGAVIEWEYEIRREHWTLIREWTLQRDVPVLETRFTTREKRRKKYSYEIWLYARVPYEQWCETRPRELQKGFTTREIVCREIPAFRDEDWSPPEEDTRAELIFNIGPGWRAPHLYSWANVGEGWQKEIEEFLSTSSEAKKLAVSLTESARSDAEKVDAIYSHVQRNIKLRRVGMRIGDLRGEAENVDELLARGGGKPDHVTMLVLAMLRAVGVEVTPIVVVDRRDGKMVWKYSGYYQADHLMLEVETDGHEGFLDPSCRDCQPGIPAWPYTSEIQNGIVIERAGSLPRKVHVTPVPAELNSERSVEHVVLHADGNAEVEGEITWHGQRDVDVRRRWRLLSESARRDAIVRRLPGAATEVDVEIADPEDAGVGLRATYSYQDPGAAFAVEGNLLIEPGDVFTGKLRFSLDFDRQHPVWIRYPFAVRSQRIFTTPEGYVAGQLPERSEIEGPGLTFRQMWAADTASRQLQWTGLLIVRREEISAEEYPEYVEFVNDLHRALRDGVALRRSEP
ncbi:MAG: DUF3857 and transglutaminase domain-containing protein [bacterium]|nr:DUF3857 and transglutaminase domain-containing protein [bacterium]